MNTARKTTRLLGAVSIALLMALSLVLVGCGGPKTVEEYVNTDEGQKMLEEVKAQADDYTAYGDMDIQVNENNILYIFTFNQTFDTNPFEGRQVFSDSDAQTLANTIKDMEDESGIKGITMEYQYKDSEGTLLYTTKFNNEGEIK